MNQAINNIKTMMTVEYKELTAPFGRLRSFIPLMIIGFIMTVFFGLFLLIDSIFSIFEVHSTIELNEETISLIAFVLTLETFLSFFLPITVPLSRFSIEGRQFDLLLSLPVKHWHVLLGVFLAEAILSLPLFILTGTGSIFLLTYLFFQDLTFTLEISILSLFLIFLLSTTSLWLGLLVTRFLTQVRPSNVAKPTFNLMLSLVAVLLILLIDSISRNGRGIMQNGWFQFLPPLQASRLIMNALVSKNIDLILDLPILLTFLVELFLILAMTTVVALKLNLQPSNIAERQFFIVKFIVKILRLRMNVPEQLTIDWILFKRFLRDIENISRLVLSIVLSLTILFLFQKFIIINVPINQENTRLVTLLVEAATIFGFLGMISIVAFLESSFFAMEARENILLFLTIPKSLRTLMTKKLVQIEIQMTIVTTIIVLIGWSWKLLPANEVVMIWITLMMLGIPMPLILLGIYQLNPPSDEQDATHLFNAFIFFIFLLASQFFIIFLLLWMRTSRMVTIMVLSILFFSIGTVIFYFGVQNLEHYDIGKGMGPHTNFFRSFVKLTGIFVLTQFTAILISIIAFRLTRTPVTFILGFYTPHVIVSVTLLSINKDGVDSAQEREEITKDISWKLVTLQVLGIIVLGLMLISIIPSSSMIMNPLVGMFGQLPSNNQIGNILARVDQVIMSSLQALILLFVMVSIEELFFRKALIDYLQKEKFRKPVAIGISAFFFTIAHASILLASAVTTFLLGIVLANVYIKRKSLKECILVHFTYNVLTITVALALFILL